MSAHSAQVAAVSIVTTDLVARIAAGDCAAEREFVMQFERGVRTLVRRYCRPGDPIAEDLAQDVLMRVLERLRAGAVQDANMLPAYVQATVVYTTSAEYRNRHVTESVTAIENNVSQENPVESLTSMQLATHLRTVLEALPVARDRAVLKLFYLDERDKNGVCSDLGIDAAHFHRVVFRARERFRTLLDQAGIRDAG